MSTCDLMSLKEEDDFKAIRNDRWDSSTFEALLGKHRDELLRPLSMKDEPLRQSYHG